MRKLFLVVICILFQLSVQYALGQCVIQRTINQINTACNYLGGSNGFATEAGMSQYDWSIVGGEILSPGPPFSNAIYVRWTAAVGPYSLSVNYTDTNGCRLTTPISKEISLGQRPVITGPTTMCQNAMNQIYSTNTGMTNYSWTIGSGHGEIISGQGTNSITVNWTTGNEQNQSYVAVSFNNTLENSCMASNSVWVNINPSTKQIFGPTNSCVGSGAYYSTERNKNNYVWSVTNGLILFGANTHEVYIQWSTPGLGMVSVSYNDPTGCNSAFGTASKTISIDIQPAAEITGEISPCTATDGYVYSTESGMTNYDWQLSYAHPFGSGLITSGVGTNTINVRWFVGGSHTLSVRYTMPSGCVALKVFPVNVRINNVSSPISGPSNVCKNDLVTFTASTGSLEYNWSIVGGTIISGIGTNSVSVVFNAYHNQSVRLNNGINSVGCQSTTSTHMVNVQMPYKPQNLVVNIPLVNYATNPFEPSTTSTSGFPVMFSSSAPSVISVSGNLLSVGSLGFTTISAKQEERDCFIPSNLNYVINVTKAPLTVTASNRSKVYGNINPSLPLTYTGFRAGETSGVLDVLPTASTSATQFSNAGTYPIIPTGGSDNNYTFSYVNGTLTVGKATLTATAEAKAREYGLANPPLTIAYSGFQGTDNISVIDSPPTISTAATATSNAGAYPITLAGGTDDNYTINRVNGSLTIDKAILTATAESKTREYGLANPPLTIAYSGFKGTDNISVIDSPPTISTAATATSNAGAYPITLAGGTDNNYTINRVNGSLTINKATLTATAEAKAKVYGDVNPAFTFTYTGFRGSDNASVIDVPPASSSSATPCSHVGNYPITLTGGTDNNYIINPVNSVLSVSKAPLLAAANNQSREYGQANPSFTTSYTGLRCGDAASVIDTPPLASTTATTTSGVGTYPISLTGGVDNNYSLSLSNGTLTINKASQIISFAPIPQQCSLGALALTATSSSGLPVAYASSNGSVAYIQSTSAIKQTSGSTIITASQGGNTNYHPATSVQQTLTVQTLNGTIYQSYLLCPGGGTELFISQGTNVTWSTGGTGTVTYIYNPGTYSVRYNFNGCTYTASINVDYDPNCGGGGGDECPDPNNPNCPCTVGPCARQKIEKEKEALDFGVYPNPADAFITLQLPQPATKDETVTMTDQMGRTVNEYILRSGEQVLKIPTEQAAGGLYLLQIGTGEAIIRKKVMITHQK